MRWGGLKGDFTIEICDDEAAVILGLLYSFFLDAVIHFSKVY